LEHTNEQNETPLHLVISPQPQIKKKLPQLEQRAFIGLRTKLDPWTFMLPRTEMDEASVVFFFDV